MTFCHPHAVSISIDRVTRFGGKPLYWGANSHLGWSHIPMFGYVWFICSPHVPRHEQVKEGWHRMVPLQWLARFITSLSQATNHVGVLHSISMYLNEYNYTDYAHGCSFQIPGFHPIPIEFPSQSIFLNTQIQYAYIYIYIPTASKTYFFLGCHKD